VSVKTTLLFVIQCMHKKLSLTKVSSVHKIQVDWLNNIRRKKQSGDLSVKLEHEER